MPIAAQSTNFKIPELLAFFLPQYHPIPENDEWWGTGFTEWTNVTRGRPLFRGHHQPHFPADLGFYDLRVPETREHQARLARKAGVSGFVYYHYWFNGRRLLETPVNDILDSGSPDFPFCLCWANEAWNRAWDGGQRSIIMPQKYSEEDDRAHIECLLHAFSDPRYIKVDGRPLLLVYRASDLPDSQRTFKLWREEARKRGFPDLFLCTVRPFPEELRDPKHFGSDASIDFKPNCLDCGPRLTSGDPLEIGYRLHRVWDYEKLVETAQLERWPTYRFCPSVCPGWDNSVRRKQGGVIFRNSSPEIYSAWLTNVLVRQALRPSQPPFVFVNAWNEWAEGTHLEPCQRWGHAYLDATRTAIERAKTSIEPSHPLNGKEVRTQHCEWQGNLEKFSIHDGILLAEGWLVFSRPCEAPALIAACLKADDGTITMIGLADEVRQGRPDVFSISGHKAAQTSGWRMKMATPDGVDRAHLSFIAYHESEGCWVELWHPQKRREANSNGSTVQNSNTLQSTNRLLIDQHGRR